ncbi:fused MFS/spermidine synthase [Desulfocurvibacter africanus]|uniref:Spermine synthase n=1 Tax=Desulfocurvibacter africanus subsp. africanus str. Walvis Bay TaxID=690850 RepID=F3YXX8_DESAF|nr:fused MFS/spermidine synthase [Desulfocurvibacter africanus]EGJ50680.1 spermine synthase [Desulfocurvibacter africanus subsp. africanus str. Walvis Bay]
MLELVVFICGAMVMALEMVGSRILAPHMGTSIIVWTSLIGIILGCLSLGYWLGGKLADRSPNRKALAGIILLAALSIGLTAMVNGPLLAVLRKAMPDIYVGSIVATVLLFAAPSVLLGMVSPYAVRLRISELATSGALVGRLYAISTVGSIVGTFLSGFVLVAFLGSSTTLLVIAIILALTAILAAPSFKVAGAAGAAFLATLLMLSLSARAGLDEAGLADVDTRYNRIRVTTGHDAITGRPIRAMTTNPGGTQSAMFLDDTLELALRYTKFFDMGRHFVPHARQALMLGGGAYSYPRHLLAQNPDIKLDVVELDPGMTALARRWFDLHDDPRLRIVHEDARTFLQRTEKKYDLAFVDVFNSHYAIPFHLATLEAAQSLRASLHDGGAAVINTISAIEGRPGQLLRAQLATLRQAFTQVLVFPVRSPYSGETVQNLILVALTTAGEPDLTSADPAMQAMLDQRWTRPIPEDLPPLTDEYAPVDRYALGMVLR